MPVSLIDGESLDRGNAREGEHCGDAHQREPNKRRGIIT